MTMPRRFAALALLAVSAAAPAADLTAIDRTVAKEPAYRTKAPQYCLLAFGPDAHDRVWLALDGDTLHVDRNGNGDLTDDGEAVPAENSESQGEGEYRFRAGEVRVGGRVHKDLIVGVMRLDRLADQDESVKAFIAKDPNARGYAVSVEVEMPGRKGTGRSEERRVGSECGS